MALLQHGFVTAADAIKIVDAMPLVSDTGKKSMRPRIRRWVNMLQDRGIEVPSA